MPTLLVIIIHSWTLGPSDVPVPPHQQREDSVLSGRKVGALDGSFWWVAAILKVELRGGSGRRTVPMEGPWNKC